jgi:hypothetical protein
MAAERPVAGTSESPRAAAAAEANWVAAAGTGRQDANKVAAVNTARVGPAMGSSVQALLETVSTPYARDRGPGFRG